LELDYSIDEVGVHEEGDNRLVIASAFVRFLAFDFEIARSQLQKFAPEKYQWLEA